MEARDRRLGGGATDRRCAGLRANESSPGRLTRQAERGLEERRHRVHGAAGSRGSHTASSANALTSERIGHEQRKFANTWTKAGDHRRRCGPPRDSARTLLVLRPKDRRQAANSREERIIPNPARGE